MRKSVNYELNLVEGNDIVNPLVQDVPNYERIDGEMFKNANAGVPLATELLSGTVHALTRENPNASMFRFVATANYKSGDTFTVDGVQVTALLTTGEPLATGCYVINANVLCCLVGTVLTMFCANSLSEIHAIDSDKLGGKSAEYYASTDSVVEAVNLAQNANTISLSNREQLIDLNTKVPFSFGVDGEGNYGYFGADDSLIPFKQNKIKCVLMANSANSEYYNLCVRYVNGKTDDTLDSHDPVASVSYTIEENGTYNIYLNGASRGNPAYSSLAINGNVIQSNKAGSLYYNNSHELVVGDVITLTAGKATSTSGSNSAVCIISM